MKNLWKQLAAVCLFVLFLSAVAVAGAFFAPLSVRAESATRVSPDDPFAALQTLSERYGFSDAREEFKLERTEDVAYGKIYRFQQIYRGVPVAGRGINLSVNGAGELLFCACDYYPVRSLVAPELSWEELSLPEQTCFAEETVFTLGERPLPAYRVTDGETISFLSALDGKELMRFPLAAGAMVQTEQKNARGEEVELEVARSSAGIYTLADEVRNLYVFDMGGGTSVDLRQPFTSETGTFDDPLAVSAFETLVKAYDFYADAQNIGVSRKGILGNDDGIAANHRENHELPVWLLMHYSRNYQNANYQYDGEKDAALLYVGDGSAAGPVSSPATARDIVAHEYQHAITQFTVGLYYLNESGAVNEAVSDLMGALVEGYEPSDRRFWMMGEDATPDNTALRSAIATVGDCRFNAKNAYPLCVLNHIHGNCDYGGVHYNSTILTHFQYDLWRKFPSFFTRQRIGTLWYSTLLSLTPDTTFSQFAQQIRNTAEALGYPADVLSAIGETLFESGLTDEESHLVTFRDALGRITEQICVRDGEAAPLPEPPEDVLTERYVFTFRDWDCELSHITEDTTATARYTSRERYYTVRFFDENGELLKTEQTLYGGRAEPPPSPAKPSDELFDYDFDEWSEDCGSVTKDLDLFPVYRRVRCYRVNFLDEDGLPLYEVRVREGESAVPPQLPQKESTEEFCFLFDGWDRPVDSIWQDLTVRAIFKRETRLYRATFLSDGKIYAVMQIPYNFRISLPDLTGKARTNGERFAGWYLDEALTIPARFAVAVKDVTLYAKWEPAEDGCSGAAESVLLFPVLLPFFFKRRRLPK